MLLRLTGELLHYLSRYLYCKSDPQCLLCDSVQHRFNLTKTVRKFPIDSRLQRIGQEVHAGPVPNIKSHGDAHGEEDIPYEHLGEGAVELNQKTFDTYTHLFPVLVVNFYAPWCSWCARLKPSWERAAQIMAERYNPETDGRILLAKVDCTQNQALCREHHIQGYPSIRIFRKGHDLREGHGHHDHESYYGERDTDSLVAFMMGLVPAPVVDGKYAIEDKSNNTDGTVKRPAPRAGGCRIEGFVKVKKVPGELMISAHSGAHSFDAAKMNMTHHVGLFSFGNKQSWRSLKDANRLLPELDSDIDHLTGEFFISEHENITVCLDSCPSVILSYFPVVIHSSSLFPCS
jgi:thiol-disulfide isomerase/thioredoxin